MRKLSPILFGLFVAFNAHAAHRTFVAASGTDSGTCGPTAQCRTLDYAMSQTDSGGEAIITESGGYGSSPSGGITITKSISIISQPGIVAALAPTSGYDGITIATALINVAIKGLTINGRGGNGINMTDGTSLDLDNVSLTNVLVGLRIDTPARVTVKHSTFRNNTVGIRLGFGANLFVENTQLTDMHEGIEIIGGTSGTTIVTATDIQVRCSSTVSTWGFDNFASSGTVGKMYLDRVTATNCQYGVHNEPSTDGVSNIVAISNSFVANNTFGLINKAGNTFLSAGNNHLSGNVTDTSGVITPGTILY